MGTEEEDRELSELIAELRVILPGVTVLFAFLLGLPFTARFAEVEAIERVAFFVGFLGSGASMVLLMGASAYHRVRGKPYDKARLIKTATRQTVAALTALLVSLTAVVFLVTRELYRVEVAISTSIATAAFASEVWLGLPLLRRWTGR